VNVRFILLALALLPGRASASSPCQHQAYIWQRVWTDSVRSAVREHGTEFSSLVVLGAEISFKKNPPQVSRAAPDYETLRRAGRPTGLALRIGPYAGPFTSNAPSTQLILATAKVLIDDAEKQQVAISELQLDFDCAASKLNGYRAWVELLRKQIRPVPLTITTLPSWLKHPSFARLAAAADGYVLQVHSLHSPKDYASPFSLCDPREALQAVELAGKLPTAFRVALPTYGYTMAFNPQGKFIGLNAEGPSKSWPPGTRIKEVRADPVEMAHLALALATNRPPACQGIIWYRLLISHDILNWRWPTLSAIVASRIPRESARAESRRVEAGLYEISLVNNGELDFSSRLALEVRWQNARLVASDGLHGFDAVNGSPSTLSIKPGSRLYRLPAGESQVIGWLRLSDDREVQVELSFKY
jgi:hypothetical protein